MAESARRGRGGGGAARRAARSAVSFETAKYIERNIPNYEVLTEEALQIIEYNADTVLEEIGVNFPDNPEALALWRAVRAAPVTGGVFALLATMVQMGLLGALLSFSGTALYAPHYIGPIAWGLSPIDDQNLAGLIMWVPGAGFYLVAALMLMARWFSQEQKAVAA